MSKNRIVEELCEQLCELLEELGSMVRVSQGSTYKQRIAVQLFFCFYLIASRIPPGLGPWCRCRLDDLYMSCVEAPRLASFLSPREGPEAGY